MSRLSSLSEGFSQLSPLDGGDTETPQAGVKGVQAHLVDIEATAFTGQMNLDVVWADPQGLLRRRRPPPTVLSFEHTASDHALDCCLDRKLPAERVRLAAGLVRHCKCAQE